MSNIDELVLGREPDIELEVGGEERDLEMELEPDLEIEMGAEPDIELDADGEEDLVLEDSYPGAQPGTDDYNELIHKPQINGVTLAGNKTLEQLVDFLVIDGGDAAWVTGEGAIHGNNP